MVSVLDVVLGSDAALIAGRGIVSSFFWIAGLFGVLNFGVICTEMRDVSLPWPRAFAAATIATQLVGSFFLITNVGGLTWLGAGMLGVFTLLCIPVGHAFWRFAKPKRTSEFHIALEHVALTGGLMLAAVASL